MVLIWGLSTVLKFLAWSVVYYFTESVDHKDEYKKENKANEDVKAAFVSLETVN